LSTIVRLINLYNINLSISVLTFLTNQRYQPVIELGVGNGRDALFFHHFDVNIVGVDLSTSAVEVNQHMYQYYN